MNHPLYVMTKEQILTSLLSTKIVAIIRLDQSESVYQVAKALLEGGVNAIEVTVGTPNALKEIEKLANHKGILPGVGSVVDAKTAKAAIQAGAEFIVTPTSKLEVIQMAHQYGKPVLSGAMTPTVGSTLVNKKLIAQKDFKAITAVARQMRIAVDNAS